MLQSTEDSERVRGGYAADYKDTAQRYLQEIGLSLIHI